VDELEPDGDALQLAGTLASTPASWVTDRVLIAVGREPRLPEMVDLRAGGAGRALATPDEVGTLPRLRMAGDVRRGRDRQVAIAAGDGVRAAMTLARELQEEPSR
jgi:thioredoxin reductase